MFLLAKIGYNMLNYLGLCELNHGMFWIGATSQGEQGDADWLLFVSEIVMLCWTIYMLGPLLLPPARSLLVLQFSTALVCSVLLIVSIWQVFPIGISMGEQVKLLTTAFFGGVD
jgi:hypothetical protein